MGGWEALMEGVTLVGAKGLITLDIKDQVSFLRS